MATVYLAHDIALARNVAIKVMSRALFADAGFAERFKREARTAASLSHPNIIPIYAVKEGGRVLYFVMKFIEGRPPDSIIKELGALPIPMVQAIVNQGGSALGYAHKRHVVHRDVKPANIMVDSDGWAVVTDFGIAKVSEAHGLTMTGATVGTRSYMSPHPRGRTGKTTATIAGLTIAPGRVQVAVGDAVQLSATARRTSGSTQAGRGVTWASTNTDVVTVSAAGLATGVAPGSATVTATQENTSATATIVVTPAGAPRRRKWPAVAALLVAGAAAGVWRLNLWQGTHPEAVGSAPRAP